MSALSNFKDSTTLIAKGVSIEGNINGNSIIELEGNIVGNITCNILTIRENGVIKGDLNCKVINIKGNFVGKAFSEKINISEAAKINGILEYKFLSVEYGANINCELKRINDLENQNNIKSEKKPEKEINILDENEILKRNISEKKWR